MMRTIRKENEPSFWRIVLLDETNDVAVWPVCKEKGLIAIDFPDKEHHQQVRNYKDEVKIGDKVISYSLKGRIGGVGTITGEYEDYLITQPKHLDYFKGKFWRRRKVDWDFLPKESEYWLIQKPLSKNMPGTRQAFCELSQQQYEFILHQIGLKEQKNIEMKTLDNDSMKESNLDILDLLNKKKQIIFYGPPGTGKTFKTQTIALQAIQNEKQN